MMNDDPIDLREYTPGETTSASWVVFDNETTRTPAEPTTRITVVGWGRAGWLAWALRSLGVPVLGHRIATEGPFGGNRESARVCLADLDRWSYAEGADTLLGSGVERIDIVFSGSQISVAHALGRLGFGISCPTPPLAGPAAHETG